MRFTFAIIVITLTISSAYATSISASDIDTAAVARKQSFFDKVIDYFNEANKSEEVKDFDFSIIGGPHYSSDTKLGIGLVAAGLYRNDKVNTELPPSNVSIYADATTSGFFTVGIRGTNISRNDRYRLNYDVSFNDVTSKFWGIGYDNAYNDSNESKYKYLSMQSEVTFTRKFATHLYFGPIAAVDYICGRNFERPDLLDGMSMHTFNVGAGVTFIYDSRDFLTNAYSGINVRVTQRFNPRFLANNYAFSLTELTATSYHPLWRDALLATLVHGRFTYGNTPWGLMSYLGGDNMRGYYEGRYRDKSEFDVCVELRQHIWHRNSAVVWGGFGSIFDKFSNITLSHLLPNYGIGYRWEFKHRVNVRLDLGFGRHQTGFIFNINEAF
jgi:hypothetical protein